jgi:hypothetical protein
MADDAIAIDSSTMTAEEVALRVLTEISKKQDKIKQIGVGLHGRTG